MSCFVYFASLFFLAFFASFISYTQQQSPTYIYNICSNATTYTKNSIYSSNLKSLLTSLSTTDRFFSIGFYSTVAGQSPDMVYGAFMCRGDMSPEFCRNCVLFATKEALVRCPNGKMGLVWYDQCRIRYADNNFFLGSSLRNGTNGIILANISSISSEKQDRFRDLLLSTLKQAATKASNSSRRFDTRKANYTASQSLYVMVQCIPDLQPKDCLRCLQLIIDKVPTDRIGGILLEPSCSTRYELYPFAYQSPQLILDSAPPPPPRKGGNSSVVVMAVVVPVTAVFILLVAVFVFRAKRKRTAYETEPLAEDEDDVTSAGSLQFDFKAIEAATDKFSQSNKLGQGGFGEVYKGTFPSGVQVAVKRLSKTSGQGEREFQNEVVVVAKLQHRNLVRLLGFCLEIEEKILVYEFVPNKSLDYFLFDSTMQSQLNWTIRYKIIGGIARGILYLHQDSRLTIIHRDLKAGNILLDVDMNPKIADFGTARIFGMDQTEANTRRIVGTYGYMSPEYAMYGQFSMKSDVYSFGVLVLEIISGKKNSSFYDMDDSVGNLVTNTWRLWNNGSPLELVDPSFQNNYQTPEITRCIHIALLCVQEKVDDRPNMPSIVQMLTTSSMALVAPRPPGFYFPSTHEQVDRAGPSIDGVSSVDEASITSIAPR